MRCPFTQALMEPLLDFIRVFLDCAGFEARSICIARVTLHKGDAQLDHLWPRRCGEYELALLNMFHCTQAKWSFLICYRVNHHEINEWELFPFASSLFSFSIFRCFSRGFHHRGYYPEKSGFEVNSSLWNRAFLSHIIVELRCFQIQFTICFNRFESFPDRKSF